MKSSALIYSILSIVCFYTMFFYPQVAMFLLFFSPYFLLSYFENDNRTKSSDILSLLIFVGLLIIQPLSSLYYLLMVIIPVFISVTVRDKYPDKSYISPLLSPVPFVALLTIALLFFTSFQEMLNKSILEFISVFTKPLENSADKFSNLGIISFLMADKEKAAKYIASLLPCLSYAIISIVIFVTDRLSSLKNETEKDYGKRDFSLPDKFVWVLIFGGFLILLPFENIKFLSYNIIVICGILYFFQGIQMISIFFDKIKVGGIFRGFVYAFLCTEPPVMAALSLMGLFSIWFRPKWSLREVIKDDRNSK